MTEQVSKDDIRKRIDEIVQDQRDKGGSVDFVSGRVIHSIADAEIPDLILYLLKVANKLSHESSAVLLQRLQGQVQFRFSWRSYWVEAAGKG